MSKRLVVAGLVGVAGIALLVYLASVDAATVGSRITVGSQRAAAVRRRVGQSRRGRAIYAVRFGSGTRRELIVGGFHGQEFGQVVARKLVAYLRTHPGSVPLGTELDVMPALNPDGIALHRRGNARNVDLNRNLPTANWSSRLRVGDPSRSLGLNGGGAPGSEPETRALLRYLQPGFRVVIALHSAGGFLDYNGPHARALARAMSRLCHLPVEKISYQRFITGSLGEYVPAAYHVPVITVELRSRQLTAGLLRALLLGVGIRPQDPRQPPQVGTP
jgi:murein peptide amidase A